MPFGQIGSTNYSGKGAFLVEFRKSDLAVCQVKARRLSQKKTGFGGLWRSPSVEFAELGVLARLRPLFWDL